MGKKKAKNRIKKNNNFASVKSSGNKTVKKSTCQAEGTIRGLNNIGNTCFFNSCLQAVNSVISYEDIASKESFCCPNGKVYSNLLMTLQSLQTTYSRSSFNPGMLLNEIGKHAPQFKARRQHDSHELLIALLSVISDEVVENQPQKMVSAGVTLGKLAMNNHYQDDPILAHFAGKCGSIVKCLHCQARSCSLQNCLDISLQIPGSKHLMTMPRLNLSSVSHDDKKNGKKKKKSQPTTSNSQYAALVNDSEDDEVLSSSSNNDNSNSNDTDQNSDCDSENNRNMMCGNILDELVELVVTGDTEDEHFHVSQQEDCRLNDLKLEPEPEPEPEEEEEGIDIIEPVVTNTVDKENGLSVYSLLNDFTSPEELLQVDGNGYICAQCSCISSSASSSDDIAKNSGDARVSVRRDAQKRLLLVTPPPVLILHLKRLLSRGKCSKFVSFPLVLSIKDYLGVVIDKNDKNQFKSDEVQGSAASANAGKREKNNINMTKENDIKNVSSQTDIIEEKEEESCAHMYSLSAVVVHQGGALGGHYIAYVKAGAVWHYASDNSTRVATEAEILKTEAYMLFYKQVGTPRTSPETEEGGAANEGGNEEEEDEDEDEGKCEERARRRQHNGNITVSPGGGHTAIAEGERAGKRQDSSSFRVTTPIEPAARTVDLRWVKSLKPAELKQELHMRNLSIQGSKKELLLRLLEASY